MISFKKGVKIFGIRPELMMAFQIAEGVYSKYNTDLVITSIVDGRHSYASLHYCGCAGDIRTRNLPKADSIQAVGEEIRQALTEEYDVVVESNHIHIEFQPKRGS